MPSAAEAAQSTRRTGDLLRRIKEQTTSMKHHPPPSEAELDLLVSWFPAQAVARNPAAHRSPPGARAGRRVAVMPMCKRRALIAVPILLLSCTCRLARRHRVPLAEFKP